MAGTSSFVAQDLSQDDLLAQLRALRPAFEREGVTRMTLFGSRARCDNRPDSDVDLVIDVNESRKFSLLDLIGIEHLIEDSIGVPANIQMRRSLRPDFVGELDRDGVSVF